MVREGEVEVVCVVGRVDAVSAPGEDSNLEVVRLVLRLELNATCMLVSRILA